MRTKSWSTVSGLFIAAAFAGTPPAQAYDYTYIRSNFDSGGEGWTLAGTGTLEWVPSWYIGMSGYLRATDSGPGDLVLVAPPAFHGNLSVFDGGTIWFFLEPESGCTTPNACGTVTISGPAGSASLDLIPGAPDPEGLHFGRYYVAALTAAAWSVTPAAWAALLANVTDIRILLDCAGQGEVLAFDDFTLASAPDGLFPQNPNYWLYDDEPGDNFIRRTSQDILPVNPNAHLDLLQYRIGNWMPADPNTDLFAGTFDMAEGPYLRFDLLLDGLVNPPGPQEPNDFDQFRYGPNPLYSVVEFDADNNLMTGGELVRAQDYFLGNIGRFGFKEQNLAERTAELWAHTQMPFENNPQVKYTGNDFELRFGSYYDVELEPSPGWVGEVESVEKRVGDADDTFEAGECWVVHGRFFCRAHGYEFLPFWDGLPTDGPYCPEVQVMFRHDAQANKTTVSLVFPIINFNEADDFSDENEASIFEALWGLTQAHHMTFNPEDDLIEDWATQDPWNYVQTTSYSIKVMVGTAYDVPAAPSDGQKFVWTDYAPNQLPGDVNGDGLVNAGDEAVFSNYVLAHDGDPIYDSDGDAHNSSLTVPGTGNLAYPRNFSLYDRNYNGVVNAADNPLTPLRPADLNADGTVSLADFVLFAQAWGGPRITVPPAGCGIGLFSKTDQDADADVDLADFAAFQRECDSP